MQLSFELFVALFGELSLLLIAFDLDADIEVEFSWLKVMPLCNEGSECSAG